MSTPARLVDKDAQPKEPGDVWFDPDYSPDELSQQYLSTWAGRRPPIVAKLPDGSRFCLDARSTKAREAGTHEGWTVTGDPPCLTVQPSIQVIIGPFPDGHEEETYHGFLTNGVFS